MSIPMTAARMTQIVNHTLSLQVTRTTHAENAFGIPDPALALCAEASLHYKAECHIVR